MQARNTRAAWATLVALTFLALAACQYVTPPEPTTPTETLGVIYGGISAAAVTAKQRLEAGSLTVEQAGHILAALDNAKGIADLATEALEAGNAEDSTLYIGMAQRMLAELETRMRQ